MLSLAGQVQENKGSQSREITRFPQASSAHLEAALERTPQGSGHPASLPPHFLRAGGESNFSGAEGLCLGLMCAPEGNAMPPLPPGQFVLARDL